MKFYWQYSRVSMSVCLSVSSFVCLLFYSIVYFKSKQSPRCSNQMEFFVTILKSLTSIELITFGRWHKISKLIFLLRNNKKTTQNKINGNHWHRPSLAFDLYSIILWNATIQIELGTYVRVRSKIVWTPRKFSKIIEKSSINQKKMVNVLWHFLLKKKKITENFSKMTTVKTWNLYYSKSYNFHIKIFQRDFSFSTHTQTW